MTNPVLVVRNEVASFENRTPIRKAALFWCPGCDSLHRIVFWQATSYAGPVWTWDGSETAPTVSPSILVHASGDQPQCHSFLRGGRWEFLGDSTHPLAGQTVDMVPLPDWVIAEREA